MLAQQPAAGGSLCTRQEELAGSHRVEERRVV